MLICPSFGNDEPVLLDKRWKEWGTSHWKGAGKHEHWLEMKWSDSPWKATENFMDEQKQQINMDLFHACRIL